MDFNRTYAFFLLITVVGAFLTIKICTTAYAVYDYSGDTEIVVARHSKVKPRPLTQQPPIEDLEN